MNICGLGNLLYHQNEKKQTNKNVVFTPSELYSHCQAASFPETLKIESTLGEGCVRTLGRALSQTRCELLKMIGQKGAQKTVPMQVCLSHPYYA